MMSTLTRSLRFALSFAASLLIMMMLSPAPAQADDVYTFVVKKQEDKDANRWSLSQWLETRDKMRLMDLWLAIHSPSPYEFYVGGNYEFGRFSDSYSYNGWDVTVGAYAT